MNTFRIFFLGFISLFLLHACTQDDENLSPYFESDIDLIGAIQSATDKQDISASALPANVQAIIAEEHSEKYVEKAKKASGLGFEVNLRAGYGASVGERAQLYFDRTGNPLESGGNMMMERFRFKKPKLRPCFNIVFPYSIIMPDGSIITQEKREDFMLVRDWYASNPDSEERPSFVFPVTVTFGEGDNVTVHNQEVLRETLKECAEKRREQIGLKRCFEIATPHTVTLPDGSTININNREDFSQVRDWYTDNPDVKERPKLVFPVTLVYEGGNEVVVNDVEALRSAREACGGEWRENRFGKSKCFEFVFPHTLKLPDGTTLTLNAKEDFEQVRAWYKENPNINFLIAFSLSSISSGISAPAILYG